MFGAVVQPPRGSHIEALAAALTRSDAGAPRFRTPLASLSLGGQDTAPRDATHRHSYDYISHLSPRVHGHAPGVAMGFDAHADHKAQGTQTHIPLARCRP